VVVRNGKLSAAGVQFPLAEGEEQDISPELGARHRAALGLSQETDAVIVVVSEETGTISVAEKGRLVRNLTVEALEALLMELLVRQTVSLPGLRGGSREARQRASVANEGSVAGVDAVADAPAEAAHEGLSDGGNGGDSKTDGGKENEELIGSDR